MMGVGLGGKTHPQEQKSVTRREIRASLVVQW